MPKTYKISKENAAETEEIRKRGFKNEVFQALQKVVDRLCVTIGSLSKDTIKSITGR